MRAFFVSFLCLWAGAQVNISTPSLKQESRAISGQEQNILAEMRQRRIIPPESRRWTPEDEALLARIRSAEASGALALLKRRFRSLKGLVVNYKAAGASISSLRLTKEGYERYRFARSQAALEYFESKGVEVKWAFLVKDMENRPVFDSSGVLTEAGEDVYNRAIAGLEVHLKLPSGEVFGNRPPKNR